MNKFIHLLVFIVIPSLIFGISQEQLKEKMIDDLKVIENSFEVKYAPKEWKRIFKDWDLKTEMSLTKQKILEKENITVKDYQFFLKQFFDSPHDFHVDIQFYSTAFSYLPFFVKSAEGRYFINAIVSEKDDVYKKNELAIRQIAVGDEVIGIDGKPVATYFNDFLNREYGERNCQTGHALAQMFLTMRIGSLGHEMPQGPIEFLIKSNRTGEIYNHTFLWEVISEEISDAPYQTGFYSLFSGSEKKKIHPFFLKEATLPSFYALLKAHQYIRMERDLFEEEEDKEEEEDLFELYSKEGFLPNLGEVIWEAPSSFKFKAYVFKNADGRRIGYIRLPHYMPSDDHPRHFSYLINIFEDKTDALVIDQLDNGGGVILYMYALASMLSPTPLEVFPQKMTLTQQDVFFALMDYKELKDLKGKNKESDEDKDILGYPTDRFLEDLEGHVKFIINEWNAGRQLTSFDYLYGIKYLQPHAWGTYSKPILVLVNEMDISCGDFFPALLQDNKRATIFGTKTGGAGGYVLNFTHPSQFGILSYTLTGSILERFNKQPIENLGVTPDIYYELTAADVQGNEYGERYQDYIKAVNQALNDLLPEVPPKKPNPYLAPSERVRK